MFWWFLLSLGSLSSAVTSLASLPKQPMRCPLQRMRAEMPGCSQGGVIRALVVERQAELLGQGLDRALDPEEILVLAPGHKAQVQAFLRQLGDGQLFGEIDVGQLEQAAGSVAVFQLVTAAFSSEGASSVRMMVRLELMGLRRRMTLRSGASVAMCSASRSASA